MTSLTTPLLQGVLPTDNRKAQFVRDAFWKTHRCGRSKSNILVIANSDGSMSVRNVFDGGMYDVTEIEKGYKFECAGFDPYGASV